ncbi:MAG: GGDEF domain-containing protein [Candidatus Dormibacteraeota bacterium]|nr:GGDEF domain-containing protein [Candidatus Dormibacteraeota bacterium]
MVELPAPMLRRARWWNVMAALVALLIAGTLAVLLTNAAKAYTYTWFDNLAQTVAPAAGAAACFLAATRHRGRIRIAWILIGASSLAWGLGQGVWDWYQLFHGVQTPFPSFADAGYLGAVPLALLGVLCFPMAAQRRSSYVGSLLDGLLIAGALLIVSWNTVLGAVYRSGGSDTLSMVLSLLYPLSDVAILTIVLLRVRRIPRGGSIPLLLVAAGLVANAVADSAFAFTTANNTYGTGIATDAGWVAGYLLIALAGLRGVARPLRGDAPRLMPSRVRALLPYPTVAAALGMTIFEHFNGGLSNFTFITMLVLVAVVLVRQYIVVGDNVHLVTTLTVRERELAFQAQHDALTGLPNRSFFRDSVARALAERQEESPCAVLFIDLDDFKRVNDTLGHAVGDKVLIAVGDRLRSCVRPSDLAARLGGDEFAVLVEQAPDQEQLDAIARRILLALREPLTISEIVLPMRGTVGLAVAVGDTDSTDELLRRADVAMYAAKREGKDRVGVYRALAA